MIKVGNLKDYVFMYEPKDGSCVMVHENPADWKEISSIGEMPLYKFITLHGFRRVRTSDMFLKSLVSYKLLVDCEYYSRISVSLDLFIIYKRHFSDCDFYGCIRNGLDYQPFCRVSIGVDTSLSPYIRRIDSAYGSFNGFAIPVQMAGYLDRLANNHDLDGMIAATDGLLGKNLILMRLTDWGIRSITGISNIEWDKSR